MDVSALRLAAATFSPMLLGVTFGALTLAVGCFTGSRRTSVAAAVAVVTYFSNAASGVVSYLQTAKLLSPFFYYRSTGPSAHGLNPAHAAVLPSTTAILLGAGYFGLWRRDLRL